MPDHMHLVWMGLADDSDQRNAMAFLRTYLEPALAPRKFQPQPFDHVLKDDERRRNGFERVCWYILENPLRKALVNDPRAWRYVGAVVPGYPHLHPFDGDY